MIELDLEKIAKENLSKYRFNHSVNVKSQAMLLGEHYGVDVKKCEIGGILHDITKELDIDTQLQLILKSDIIVPSVVLKTPKLYHAVTGMIYVKDKLGINDDDILNAIRYHTTARENMSKLEKIVYIADATSVDRDYEQVEKFRELSFVDLDLCMLELIKYTINYLINDNCIIPTDTIKAYNQYAIKVLNNNKAIR